MKNFLKSYKTATVGIFMIAYGVYVFETTKDASSAWVAIGAGVAAILSKDFNTTNSNDSKGEHNENT